MLSAITPRKIQRSSHFYTSFLLLIFAFESGNRRYNNLIKKIMKDALKGTKVTIG